MHSSRTKIMVVAAIVVCAVAVCCWLPQGALLAKDEAKPVAAGSAAPASAGAPASAPAATSAPTSAPYKPTAMPAPPAPPANGPNNDTAVMAYINGRPIYMAAMNDLMVRAIGGRMAQQLLASELIDQEAFRLGITVTAKDVAAESDRTLAQVFGTVDDPAQRERLLDQLLEQKGVSRAEWELTMRRNTLMNKIIADKVKVTEQNVRDEFAEQYGRKILIRHIQTETLQDAQEVLKKYAAKTDFAELARKFSKNVSAQEGGLLPPIGQMAPGLPPPLRDAAHALKKVGDVSAPVQVGTSYHVLYLEKVVEPQDVKFDLVKERLQETIRLRQVQMLQVELLQGLIRNARIEYVNPVIKAVAEQGVKP